MKSEIKTQSRSDAVSGSAAGEKCSWLKGCKKAATTVCLCGDFYCDYHAQFTDCIHQPIKQPPKSALVSPKEGSGASGYISEAHQRDVSRAGASLKFTFDEASEAWDGKFNCGPAAICAALHMTPTELRPLMGDFEAKGYTNPTLMFEVLNRCKARYRRTFRSDDPADAAKAWQLQRGLVRIQFGGPWTKPGVPMKARYRVTHWVAAQARTGAQGWIFDVNAMCVGGWIDYSEWATQLIPWLIRECYPKADGTWWPTHAIEIVDVFTSGAVAPAPQKYNASNSATDGRP